MSTARPIFECTGCGTVTRDPQGQLALYRRAGHLSCCPERRMLPMRTGAPDPVPAAREACARLEEEIGMDGAPFREGKRDGAAAMLWATAGARAMLAPSPPRVELGPDGEEWATTEAAYQHVKNIADDRMILPDGAIVWRGRSVREAFIAGAEWQAERSKGND